MMNYKQSLRFAVSLIALAALFFSSVALSQSSYVYRVFLDTDVNEATGCGYDMGTTANTDYQDGFEQYLELSMLAPGEINQYGISGAMVSCAGGIWNTNNANPIASASWSATLGVSAQADSIEGFIPRDALNYSTITRVVINAKNSTAESADTVVGDENGPIYIAMLGENIPVLSNIAFALLVVTLLFISLRSKAARIHVSGLLLTLTIGSSFYITSVDGQPDDHCTLWGWCMDWLGATPIVTDSTNDTSDPAVDIQAVYITEANNGDIAVRIDINDVSNACVSLSPCDINASCSNEPTGFSCACNEGFFGDGFSCASGGSVLSAPLQSAQFGTLIPVSCVDGDCSCPVGYSGPGVIIVYSYAYSGVCTEVANPDNSTCSNGTCACDSGYAPDSIFGDPVWNGVTQTYDGNCVSPINALYDQAFFDVPAYQFVPELSSGEFGVTTWQ